MDVVGEKLALAEPAAEQAAPDEALASVVASWWEAAVKKSVNLDHVDDEAKS